MQKNRELSQAQAYLTQTLVVWHQEETLNKDTNGKSTLGFQWKVPNRKEYNVRRKLSTTESTDHPDRGEWQTKVKEQLQSSNVNEWI